MEFRVRFISKSFCLMVVWLFLFLFMSTFAWAASVPDAPKGLEIEETGSGRITVTWDKVSGAKSYKVYVECKEADKDWEFSRSVCELKLKGLEAGKTYKIYVTAINEEGESKPGETKEIKISEPDVPDAPKGLKIEETGSGRITVTWDKVSGAKSYKVYVECKEVDKDWEFSRSVCELKLKGLEAGKTYKIYVTAINEEGESKPGETKEIKISEPDVPDAPKGLELEETGGAGRLTVTWDKVSEAKKYNVYVKCEKDKKEWEFERSKCELKLKGLEAGKTYEIYVTAINEEGESKPGEAKEIKISEPDVPDAPKGLELEETGGAGRLTVIWDKVSGAKKYNVYVKCEKDKKEWEFERSKCELKLKGLEAGKIYEICVTAINEEGESKRSKAERITISKGKAPKAPKNVKVSDTYNGGLKISWDAVSEATGYVVYYKWDNESSFHQYDTKKTSCTLKNLAKKDKYEVYVKAYNSVGTSGASESIRKDNDDDEKPTKPQTLMASVEMVGSSLNVHLIWEPSEDNVAVEGYTIYRFNPDKSSDAERKWSVDADGYDDGDEITTVDKNVGKGEIYFYVVEAYDKEGNESDFSNSVEVSTKNY